jgi:hypothetical protein
LFHSKRSLDKVTTIDLYEDDLLRNDLTYREIRWARIILIHSPGGRFIMALKIFDKGSDSRPMLCEYDVIFIDAGWHGPKRVHVCREERVCLEVNGVFIASLTVSPCELAEFACGYCITEGIARDISDIEEVRIEGDHLCVSAPGIDPGTLSRPREVRTSGCVGIVQDDREFDRVLPPGARVTRWVIYSAM